MFWNTFLLLIIIKLVCGHIHIGRELSTEREDAIISKLKESNGDRSTMFAKIFSKSLEGLNWKREKQNQKEALHKPKGNNKDPFLREKKNSADSLFDDYIKQIVKETNDGPTADVLKQNLPKEDYARLSVTNKRSKLGKDSISLVKKLEKNNAMRSYDGFPFKKIQRPDKNNMDYSSTENERRSNAKEVEQDFERKTNDFPELNSIEDYTDYAASKTDAANDVAKSTLRQANENMKEIERNVKTGEQIQKAESDYHESARPGIDSSIPSNEIYEHGNESKKDEYVGKEENQNINMPAEKLEEEIDREVNELFGWM